MSLRIEVPATLANLGSGYDTLGLAVTLTNVFDVREGSDEPADDDPSALVVQTARRAARRFGGTLPPFTVEQIERVPRSRGMGSSATARVAGLLAYASLCDVALQRHDQLAFLADEEGHPDNVWPALLGGLVICGGRGRRVRVADGWSLAVISPPGEVSTPAARAALPESVPHADAVANIRAVALLLSGLVDGDIDAVRLGVQDHLHQPWRAPLIGPVEPSFAAALQLGAAPFVSGSGSTLAAFVAPGTDARSVARAMAAPFQASGDEVAIRALSVRQMGAVVADLP